MITSTTAEPITAIYTVYIFERFQLRIFMAIKKHTAMVQASHTGYNPLACITCDRA
jgi:hypothetical protein